MWAVMNTSATNLCLHRGDKGVRKNFCFRCRDDQLPSEGSIVCIDVRVRLCTYTVQVFLVIDWTMPLSLCACAAAVLMIVA
jgi:hypothetical protein